MRYLIVLLAAFLVAGTAHAQISYGGAQTPAVSAGIQLAQVDFSFVREGAPDASFNFSDPTYGIFYSRQGFNASFARGSSSLADGGDLILIDGTVSGWAGIRPFENSQDKKLDIFFPVGISSDYRKVRKKDGDVDADIFEVTVLALGAGLGATTGIRGSDLSIRAMPFYGLASRSFGNDTGSSAVLTTNVEWASGSISDRFGIYFSYGYRWQQWNLNTSIVLDSEGKGDLTYEGSYHAIQIGLTF